MVPLAVNWPACVQSPEKVAVKPAGPVSVTLNAPERNVTRVPTALPGNVVFLPVELSTVMVNSDGLGHGVTIPQPGGLVF
jgi:hypothetical protein